MKKLIIFLSLVVPVIASSQIITDTLRVVHGNGDTVKTVAHHNSQTTSLQQKLVSGTTIKTVNGNNLLGSGDISISGSAAWGSITGTLSGQTDLQSALDAKQNSLGFTAVPNTRTVNGSALSSDVTITTITGNAGTATALQNARTINGQSFDGTANITIPGSAVTSIPTSSITSYIGHTINIQALTSSPADAATVYFGMLPKAPTTTSNISKVYVRQAGTITAAEIYCYSGTAGTNESWSLYIRVNNTTDYLIATVSAATSERVFTNSSLSISLNANDYFEIKGVQPTWTTNPATTIYGGYIKIN